MILAEVMTGGPLLVRAGDALEVSAGPSLVQETPAKEIDRYATRRRIRAESERGEEMFATPFIVFQEQKAGRGADSPAHDLFLTTLSCLPWASVSLMNPTDKAAIVVLERGLCLAECSGALLEIESSPLAQVHGSRRRQSNAETQFRRHVGVQAGRSRADYRRC